MTTDERDLPADPGASSTGPAARPAPRRILSFVVTAIIVLTVDVVSKIIVVAQLPESRPSSVKVLGGVFYLRQIRNSGAAFSLGTGFTAILTVVAVVIVVVIIRVASRLHSRWWAVSLGLILGGALGNLSDRIFRAPGVGRGAVVDWISLFGPDGDHWPIFNLADSCIVAGAVLAALLTLIGVDFRGRRGEPSHAASARRSTGSDDDG